MSRKFPESGYNPVTGEWNDSLMGEFLWSNVNVSEAVPDVMTPSTWSLWWIYHFEASPFKFPGDYPFCGNVCGRPYLNLSLISSLYRAIGRDVRKELQGDMIGSAPAELDIPMISISPLVVLWMALPGMIKARMAANRDVKRTPEFLAEIPYWCRSMRTLLKNTPDKVGLSSIWVRSIKPTFVRACRMLRSVTMIAADRATKLRLELSALVGEAEADRLISNFSSASGDLESLGPLVGLAKVKDNRLSRAQYMERYGHRDPHEMELLAPGADDDPTWFEKKMVDFNQSTLDVEVLLTRQRAEFASTWQRFETHFPQKSRNTRQLLDIATNAAKNREAVRSEVTRITRLIRVFLLQAGKVSGIGDDIFFLSLDEMVALLRGIQLPLTRIPARREMYQRYCSLPPYPAIIVGRFDPFQWAADPHRRSDFYEARQKGAVAAPVTIKGFAGAAGVVEGIVRRIDRVEDGYQILQGEILVTTSTNVGWTPIFPRLAAIVTDVGAPLSHAAIVARELGIPAVVGCGNATMLLKTGDLVCVDGGAGIVELR